MEWALITVIAAVVIAAGLAFIWWMQDTRSREELKSKFGREYDVVEGEMGGRRRAERELRERQERVDGFQLRPLSDRSRERYSDQWRDAQAHFVDNPQGAIREADRPVRNVMRERGYPVERFSQREADLSVNYPDLVSNYRQAHQIALRNETGGAQTEEHRRAILHYRSLFEELLTDRERAGVVASPRITGPDR